MCKHVEGYLPEYATESPNAQRIININFKCNSLRNFLAKYCFYPLAIADGLNRVFLHLGEFLMEGQLICLAAMIFNTITSGMQESIAMGI